jgi:hypothetical protein
MYCGSDKQIQKVPNDKIAKCTCGNAHSAPSRNLYGIYENSVPSLHHRVVAAILTLPPLIPHSSFPVLQVRYGLRSTNPYAALD